MSTPMLSVDTTDTDMPVTTLARDLLRPPLTLIPMPTMVTTAYLPTLTATDTVTVTVMLTTVKHYPTSNLIHNHLYYSQQLSYRYLLIIKQHAHNNGF